MNGWLIALGVLVAVPVLISLIPVGLLLLYDKDGFRYFLRVGFLRFELGKKKTQSKEKPKQKTGSNPIAQKAKAAVTGKEGGELSQFWPLLEALGKLLNDLRKKLRVKKLELHLVMGGEDPYNLALNYGRAWAAVGNILPLLEQIFVIRKRDVQVDCDFTAQSPKIYFKLDIRLIVFRLIKLLLQYGIPAYREYKKLSNTDEGGADK